MQTYIHAQTATKKITSSVELTEMTSFFFKTRSTHKQTHMFDVCLSMWLIGTVRAEPETVISRPWVQSPDPAE